MQDCIFCKIIAGDIPATKAYEDDQVVVIHDINPQAKHHLLVIPKKHMPSVLQAQDEDRTLLGHMLLTANGVAVKKGIDASGFRLVINTGADGAQTVGHLHMHILGGEKLSGRMG
ncbi:MAG: histidine triad nucleotide-binding protein [Christensenellales bacterium]|jgi:histidine triad (HIT) family protein